MSEFLIINYSVKDDTFYVVGIEQSLEDAEEFIKNDMEFWGHNKKLTIYQKVK